VTLAALASAMALAALRSLAPRRLAATRSFAAIAKPQSFAPLDPTGHRNIDKT